MNYPANMDIAPFTPTSLLVVIAVIAAMWALGTHFKKLEKRYEQEARD